MKKEPLTEEQKQEIVELYRNTSHNSYTLAEKYGVSPSHISKIVSSNMFNGEYYRIKRTKHSNGQKRKLAS